MNFEKIEPAYKMLWENIQILKNQLETHIYDALIEQNSLYCSGDVTEKIVMENNEKISQLQLTKEEWRQVYQFIFIKAAKTDYIQPNHQFTPDVIGFVILYLLETLTKTDKIEVIEIGSGTGHLAATLLLNSSKQLDYMGIELDDLLIDLSASIADVIGLEVHYIQEDAVRPQLIKQSDVIISDLPIGYYPNDAIASRFKVAEKTGKEHTYAHHLLLEQSMKYLKENGFAIVLAPSNLLTSPQSDRLKEWFEEDVFLAAAISLPESLFGNQSMTKSIFVLQKTPDKNKETFVYPLSDLQDQSTLLAFKTAFENWVSDNQL